MTIAVDLGRKATKQTKKHKRKIIIFFPPYINVSLSFGCSKERLNVLVEKYRIKGSIVPNNFHI